ncbi:hypothetical protein L1049_020791 [Liquidambar formosana]|uniref:Uncharacterized protein n=1 Tax=Liquidambar formosana TaxID=63359 RepID=A0AAP0X6D0_LIQFO
MATACVAGATSMAAAVLRPRLSTTSFSPRSATPTLPPRPAASSSVKLSSGAKCKTMVVLVMAAPSNLKCEAEG